MNDIKMALTAMGYNLKGCAEGKTLYETSEGPRCCLTLNPECSPGTEVVICEEGNPHSIYCSDCRDNTYQEHWTKDGVCKNQPVCSGPEGQIQKVTDYIKKCLHTQKKCGCKLETVGNKKTRYQWACNDEFSGLGEDYLTCYPKDMSERPIFIEKPTERTTTNSSDITYPMKTPNAASSTESTTGQQFCSTQTAIILGSVAGVVLVLAILVGLGIWCYRKRSKPRKKMKLIRKNDETINKKEDIEVYKACRDKCFIDLQVYFQRPTVCSKFYLIAQALGMEHDVIERIEQSSNDSNENKMAAVLNEYVHRYGEAESGLNFMVLLEFLDAHKEFECLNRSCDMIIGIQNKYLKSRSKTEENKDQMVDSGLGCSKGLLQSDREESEGLLARDSDVTKRGEPPMPLTSYLQRQESINDNIPVWDLTEVTYF